MENYPTTNGPENEPLGEPAHSDEATLTDEDRAEHQLLREMVHRRSEEERTRKALDTAGGHAIEGASPGVHEETDVNNREQLTDADRAELARMREGIARIKRERGEGTS